MQRYTQQPGPRRVPPWLRVVFRLPARLYALGLGPVLGRRFLRLEHVGRRSGRRYAVVLEVVRYDRHVPEFVVVSGFGERADWLRNVEAAGSARVTVGRTTFTAHPRRLGVDEAVAVLTGYERRNRLVAPLLRRVLSWLLGWRYDGSAEARRRMAGQLPLVALRAAEVRHLLGVGVTVPCCGRPAGRWTWLRNVAAAREPHSRRRRR